MTARRSLFAVLTLTLAVALAAGPTLDAVAAEVCSNTTYLGTGVGSEPTCPAAYDEAFWNAVSAIEAAHPECEMVSATVVPPIGWGVSYSVVGNLCVTNLTVRYVCRVCSGW